KIKVGFFSSYFQMHSASGGVLGWLSYHNTEEFEYSIYHFGEVLDANTAKFVSASEHFYHICLQDFSDVAQWLDRVIQTVQDNPLDIIVFTDVGMDIKSTLLARLRLAPVQCVLWGHPVTTGSEVIDYFLTADLMEPDDAPDHYSEQLVHLPNISWSYPQVGLPEQQTKRSDFQLPETRILYFSCQSLFKYLPQHDYIYPAIAQRVPQAYFLFLSILEVAPIFWSRLQKAFAAVGVAAEDYCQILPRQSHPNFLALQGLSDIYLDTLSWSGGNTTLQALAWPIPVVTCPNKFMRGRHSYGILQTLGITETIAHSEAEYIEIASELGRNPQWRSSLVEKIKSRNHRLYNDLDCVEAIETFFEYAHRKHHQFGLPT
ncbi:MAG: glycosyltransferase, partial [Prochlorotrichaceae cyanobacterium]